VEPESILYQRSLELEPSEGTRIIRQINCTCGDELLWRGFFFIMREEILLMIILTLLFDMNPQLGSTQYKTVFLLLS
jgi:hypothetical protein